VITLSVRGKNPNNWLIREISARTNTFENTYELCCFAKYTNGCDDPLNSTEIETQNVFLNMCIPIICVICVYYALKMHIGVLFHRPITGKQLAYIGMR